MKNQYFGDVNDYRKYGILRGLAQRSGLRISVCWMLTHDDGSTDGRFLRYLDEPGKWKHYDEELFTFLYDTVKIQKERAVSQIEETEILPGASYFPKEIPDCSEERSRFWAHYFAVAPAADLVFLDPDNGMEVASVPYGKRRSSKYLYYGEVQELFARAHSLLIYQHFSRENREKFIRRIVGKLSSVCKVKWTAYFQTARVVFFLVPQEAHQERVESAVHWIGKKWGSQIETGIME